MSAITAATLLDLYNKQVDADIAQRIATHQSRPIQLDAFNRTPLNLLAIGDSWFDYPLNGDLYGIHTDVIAAMTQRNILNLAHYGYTSTQEMGYKRQQLLTTALTTPANGKFDGILISAGGNDIAGDALCIWLNDAGSVNNIPALAVNKSRLDGVLGSIRSAYLDLIAIRDDLLPRAPIFVHGYDYPVVSGKGVCALGPWLKPSLDYCGWTDTAVGAKIIATMMDEFNEMLEGLASNKAYNVVHVKTLGTLRADQWANELHPKPDGFRLIAQKFENELAVAFPGRI